MLLPELLTWKGPDWAPSFHLGLKVSQVFQSPLWKRLLPFLLHPFSLEEFKQDPQEVTLVLVGTDISDRHDSFLCLSLPILLPQPSLHSFQYIWVNASHLHFNEFPQRPEMTFWEATLGFIKRQESLVAKDESVIPRSEYRLYYLLHRSASDLISLWPSLLSYQMELIIGLSS